MNKIKELEKEIYGLSQELKEKVLKKNFILTTAKSFFPFFMESTTKKPKVICTGLNRMMSDIFELIEMIEQNDIKQFLWKKIDVGVPHSFRNGLFWHSGTLVSAGDVNITIRKDNNELLCISLERIQEVRESRY
jgi:hypothetical protein